jgi:hypothetical protein
MRAPPLPPSVPPRWGCRVVSVDILPLPAARPVPAAPVAAVPVLSVTWWLVQGLALGALGGGLVSALVIAFVLALRTVLQG